MLIGFFVCLFHKKYDVMCKTALIARQRTDVYVKAVNCAYLIAARTITPAMFAIYFRHDRTLKWDDCIVNIVSVWLQTEFNAKLNSNSVQSDWLWLWCFNRGFNRVFHTFQITAKRANCCLTWQKIEMAVWYIAFFGTIIFFFFFDMNSWIAIANSTA